MRDLSNLGDGGKEQVVRRVHELLQADGWPSVAIIAGRMVREDKAYIVSLGLKLGIETKNFPTLTEAREFCNQHHARTGVVLAITEVR